MSVSVAAMMLQCFFNPVAGTVADGVPTIKVPLSSEYAQSLAALDPPENKTAFIGETGPTREWIMGSSRDPSASRIKLVRVNLTEKLLPTPYEARFGTATKHDDGNYAFSVEMTGYCNLKPVEHPSGKPQ